MFIAYNIVVTTTTFGYFCLCSGLKTRDVCRVKTKLSDIFNICVFFLCCDMIILLSGRTVRQMDTPSTVIYFPGN